MRMLCVCAKADGYLSIAGRKLDVEDMAKLTGWAATDIRTWWDELKRWGVFSVEGRGRIYCRRMVKDARKAEIARQNGKNGGNPSLRKDRGNYASDNQTGTDGITDVPSKARSQKPEATKESQVVLFPETSERDQPQQRDAAATRGARLKADWRPSADNWTYAIAQGFSETEVERVVEDFRDYWIAQPGQKGVKLDWTATWRRWIRTQAERRVERSQPRKQVDWC